MLMCIIVLIFVLLSRHYGGDTTRVGEGEAGEREGDQHDARRQRADVTGGEVLINRSTDQVKPLYRSSETVLPIK